VEGEVPGNPKIHMNIAELLGIPDGYTGVFCLPVGMPEKLTTYIRNRAFEERASLNGFDIIRR
jgi:hypothetical protein